MINIFKKNKSNSYKIPNSNEPEEHSLIWADTELSEGQLLVDVYQTPEEIIVKSTMAGVRPENLSISLNRDILTIKGKREYDKSINDNDYFLRECYFGSFSRTIILPEEVNEKKMEAILENGVLTIILKKTHKEQSVKVKIKE
jgi:HSP20 family protein